jgi:hypothetical protein
MRIPLVRFGSDLTPIAEWEEKWAPVVVPLLIVLLLVVLPVLMILGYVLLLGYCLVALPGYCLIGVFLPRRAREEWFARLREGSPVVPCRAPGGEQGGAEQVVAADAGRLDGPSRREGS